jgi:hypothetical protein
MLLPDVHDELVRIAAASGARKRLSTRTLSALAAALVTLLLVAPAAQAVLPLAVSAPPIVARAA